MTSLLNGIRSPDAIPLLSICVPTYNRAHLLKVMLEALLPQVKAIGNLVEVCISDNASTDNTAEVVQSSLAFGPAFYSKNSCNLGATGNYVRLTTQLARGEFVWLLGDDDLLVPDAVSRVVNVVSSHRDLDAFYANFQSCSFELDWPQHAVGGYSVVHSHLNCPDLTDRFCPQWRALIRAEGGLCGSIYANITRRSIWVRYWLFRQPPKPSSKSLLAYYPHTCMFADELLFRPAYYIGQPVVTAFHGAQAFIKEFSKVYACYLSQVLRYYHNRGFRGPQFEAAKRFHFSECFLHLVNLFQTEKPIPIAILFLRSGWPYRAAWVALISAILATYNLPFIGRLLNVIRRAKKVFFTRGRI